MTQLLVRRGVAALLLIWIVASCGFLLAALAPGDAAVLGSGFGATPAQIAAVRAEAGLDRPLVVQYGRWLSMLVRGDLGTSFLYRAPVGPMVLDRAINTAILALTALLLALVIGLPPAVVSAAHPNSIAARAVRAVSLLLLSIPPFVGALVLVLVAARTGWLPAGGMTSGADLTGFRWLADVLWHLPLPALALALPLAATFERQQAAALARRSRRRPCRRRVRAASAKGRSCGATRGVCRSSPCWRWAGWRWRRCSAARSSSRPSPRGPGWGGSPTTRCARATSRWWPAARLPAPRCWRSGCSCRMC